MNLLRQHQPPPQAKPAVLFPLHIEARGLLRRLPNKKTFHCEQMKVVESETSGGPLWVVLTGPGRRNAVRAAQALLDAHQPTVLIMAGLAGALQEDLKPLDIILADRVADESGERLSLSWRIEQVELGSGVHRGRLLSLDRVVTSPEVKRELGKTHDAMAVDMESFAVARLCQERGVPMAAIRVIGDSLEEALPRDIERLLNQSSTGARAGAAVRALWRRPSVAKQLWNLKRRSDQASERLGEFLAELLLSSPSQG